MTKLFLFTIVGFCGVAHAEELITVTMLPGAESVILFRAIDSSKMGGVDGYGNTVIIKRYATSDEALQIECVQNPTSLASACNVQFRIDSALNVDSLVSIGPTGAIVANPSKEDSRRLYSSLPQPKLYQSQEKVIVEYNGRNFQAPRL